MSILQSLFSGAKAFIRELVGVAAESVRVILAEADRSSFGRAATELIKVVTQRYFTQAADLAAEERELAAKRQRDGRLTERDLEELRDIEARRARLRKDFDNAKAEEAVEILREAQHEVIAAPMTTDETSSSVGILASKPCPECGSTMRIFQGGYSTNKKSYGFYWQCTSHRSPHCPTIKFDPKTKRATVLRKPDADLDGPTAARRAAWQQPKVLAESHARLRTGLGDEDQEVVCPRHLLPMRLMPNTSPGGRMLDSYAYVCLAVNADGRACDHQVPVTSFPQVAAALKRREGRGILDR
jgi:hypothetical protein